MKEKIAKIVSSILNSDENIIKDKIEIPPKKEMWDFAFPTFFLAKELKKNPAIIAWELAEKIKNKNSWFFSKVEQSWPYINFFLSNNYYSELFKKLLEESLENENNKNKTIIIDYIWANVWKPLHIGHMCTPNLGQAIINTYKKLWYNVISDSHIWDWWIIFWKLIVAYQNFWDEKKLKENAVQHLFELYVKASSLEEEKKSWKEKYQEAFKKLSLWDKKYISYWQKFTQESIKSMQKQLDKLNVKADYNIWESFYEWLDLPKLENYPDLIWSMKDIVKELIEKWIAIKNKDNSVWVIFPEELNIPSTILQKRNWTTWYLASDLAAIKYRINNWNPDKIIYFIDVRQSLHLQQVFKISDLAWWTKNTRLIHAGNWFVKLEDGAMSTRKWKIIKLEELLSESINKAKKIILEKRKDIWEEELEKLSKIIWIWAIKYEYLRKNRELDITFRWNEFMTFEGNSAPYIMYAYTRWKSILEKNPIDILNKINNFTFTNTEEFELIKKIWDYKQILIKTIEWHYPSILANYIYELTKTFNTFYTNIKVLSEKDEEKKLSRLALIKKTVDTIKDWFDILGIKLPEKM